MLDRRLLVISGKGGVGKTTIAASLGLLAAQGGRRTIVVEVGQESRLPGLFAAPPSRPGVECRLAEGLWSISIDPDRALLEWLQKLGGRVSGRVLAASGTFQYFAAAAPGVKELVTMIKVWRLTRHEGRRGAAGGYDLVVLDAPATGHALGMLGSAQTYSAITRVGPVAGHTREVHALLEDPSQTACLAVALGSEMAVTEVLELHDGLQRRIGHGLDGVIVNALLPRRFTGAELRRIEALHGLDAAGTGERANVAAGIAAAGMANSALASATEAAVRAARAVHDRGRLEHKQLARLRRHGFDVLATPYVWTAQLDLTAVEGIARRLEREL